MKSKISLFKKGLIISDLKRFWWISALYTLALFFAVPFNHYIQKLNAINNNLDWIKESISRDLSFKNGANQVFLLFVPIVIGALVFRYMQKSRSASLYHSLPLKRTTLYINSVISAVILFVSPLLCISLLMFFLKWFSILSGLYTTTLIFSWLLYSLLFGIMFLAMSIFVGMFTGNSIAQLAFIYILNFLPMFFVEFTRMNLREILFGFDTYSNVDFYNKLPMAILLEGRSEYLSATFIIIYTLVTVALLVGGLFAFKIRKPETAGDIITFRPIKPVFIYGVTVCATLLGGAYFISIGASHFLANGKSSISLALFGYFFSSLISYVIVQMITNRSFKILHTYKGYIGYALVLLILTLCVKFDVIGYVNKIPAPSDVEETYIGYDIGMWKDKDKTSFNSIKYDNVNMGIYKDPQNIENITKLHNLILDNKSKNGGSEYIAYKLKNGKRIIRRYTIDTDLYSLALGPIYESKEYKEGRYPILNQDVNDLKYIEINDSRTEKTPFIVSDKAQLESFKAAISKDINNSTYQELVYQSQRVLFINIIDTQGRNISYELKSSYTNTLAWLKNEGIYEQIVLKPENVDSVTLENFNYNVENSYGKSTQAATAVERRIEITDKAVISEILKLSIDANYNNKSLSYNVTFTQGRNSRGFNFQLSYDEASPELQSYIDKIR